MFRWIQDTHRDCCQKIWHRRKRPDRKKNNCLLLNLPTQCTSALYSLQPTFQYSVPYTLQSTATFQHSARVHCTVYSRPSYIVRLLPYSLQPTFQHSARVHCTVYSRPSNIVRLIPYSLQPTFQHSARVHCTVYSRPSNIVRLIPYSLQRPSNIVHECIAQSTADLTT